MGKIIIKDQEFQCVGMTIINNLYDFEVEKGSWTVESLSDFLANDEDYDIQLVDYELDSEEDAFIHTSKYPFKEVTEAEDGTYFNLYFESTPFEAEKKILQNEANIDYMAIMLDVDLSTEG